MWKEVNSIDLAKFEGAKTLNTINEGEAGYGVENRELPLHVHDGGVEARDVGLTHKIPSLIAYLVFTYLIPLFVLT